MDTDHDGVRASLAAWAVGALEPGERRTVPRHLAGCDACAAEAERFTELVRLLDGPAVPPRRDGRGNPDDTAVDAADTAVADDTAAVADRAGDHADGVLAAALGLRPRTPPVAPHAAPYAAAVAGLRALLPELAGRWTVPVVHTWTAHATLAHLLAADEPLAAVLGIAPRVPAPHGNGRKGAGQGGGEGAGAAGWADAWNARTADVIAHELARTPEQTVAAWAAQADALLAAPEARDTGRAAAPATLMGMRLPVAEHYLVRAFEVWIHTDDLGRALGLAVPPPPEEHLWTLVRLAVRILGGALGPASPPVLFTVARSAGGEAGDQWVLGAEDKPVRAELVVDAVDFCLLVGGRYPPDAIPRTAVGDETAARHVLATAASLAWL
ncbi:hypothetical protein GCM10010145_57260 [Streptomyces ruber]|uniref:Putative zinc-finger domain-containing protein n=2 Tax=Streptomyces TaxID=1883 RepID=A0A918BNV2_9ACTN|nr:zf-HC2 domain-containing protein [Streptomyces ruber]GGQ80118.1 hypothetical protein GCM10010145_57260 [Streptomyces ruber]